MTINVDENKPHVNISTEEGVRRGQPMMRAKATCSYPTCDWEHHIEQLGDRKFFDKTPLEHLTVIADSHLLKVHDVRSLTIVREKGVSS